MAKAKQWLTEDIQDEMQEVPAERSSQEEHATNLEEKDAAKTDTRQKRQRAEENLHCGPIDAMFSVVLGPRVEDSSEFASIISLNDELHLYLKERVIDRRSGYPLQWWKENEARYKRLTSYAKRYLSALPSSVPSERGFSEVAAIYEKNRTHLTGEHAEMLCFLHYNIVLLNWEY